MLVASLIWYFNKMWGWFLNIVLNFKTNCQWLYDLLTKTRYNLLEERMKELTCEQMVEYLSLSLGSGKLFAEPTSVGSIYRVQA